jgi:hypothetical protein
MMLVCAEQTDAGSRAAEWLDSDDPMLRAAAARWWSYRAASTGQVLPPFERCLADPDANVRDAALIFLGASDLSEELRERLTALAAEAETRWVCTHCGTENDPGSSCRGCLIVGPRIAEKVRKLLGDEQSEHQLRFRPRSTGRRLRRDFDF